MKKRVLLVAGAIIGSLALPSTVGALECALSETGPASNNTCIENIGKSCTVVNNTVIIITNSNNQQSGSGGANSSGNTTGGGATSGGASNTNSSNVTSTIDNTGACVAAAPVVPETPTPTPETPGQVQAAQTQVVAPVGGVAAGSGGADRTGVFLGILAASLLALGIGLRKLLQRQN